MRFELRYFTGTGNSWRVLETCREVFVNELHTVNISEISPDEKRIEEPDILGFCFPVYAFGLPRICRNYLLSLENFSKGQKAFVIITAGGSNEAGFSVKECERLLKKKNCNIIYSAVIEMPINWITSPEPPFPPAHEEALEIIRKGADMARSIAREILAGDHMYHNFNYPPRYTRFRFYKDYLLFRYLGVQNMWRTFKVYESCNGCNICSKICPTRSITMVEKRPVWAATCEQCMRCVNFCPQESIYQTMGGDTRGKNRYYEPGFRPKRI